MIRNTFSYLYSFLLIFADFLAILTAFVVAYIVRVEIDDRPLVADIPAREFFGVFLVLVPIWLIIFAFLGLYKQDTYKKRLREFAQLALGSALGILLLISYDWALDDTIFPAKLVPLYALFLAVGLLYIERAVMAGFRRFLLNYGYGVSNVVIVGNNSMTNEIAAQLRDTQYSGYKVLAIHGKKSLIPPAKNNIVHLAKKSDMLNYIKKKDVHVIIQTERFDNPTHNQEIIDIAQKRHIAYKFIPTEQGILSNNIYVDLLANIPVVSVYQTPLIGWGRIVKRLFDIILSLVCLAIALPIFIIVGLLIKVSDPKGKIFFAHKRVTRFGTTFKAYKLRSMYQKYSGSNKSDIEIFESMNRPDLVKEWQVNQKLRDDPRIMPIGKFIRKTSIDELPQLWNVLKGELSLIGPRPVTKEELKRYSDKSSLFLSIKPGITGLWQVSGRNQTTYEERIALDLYYIQNWSFLNDLKILYRTAIVMLTGKGQ